MVLAMQRAVSGALRYHARAMLHDFLAWYANALDTGGYWLVGLLMAMESSVVPLPSEVVIPGSATSPTHAAA